MAAPGDYILLLYNEPGQPLYHEALVTGVSAATPTTITMATPDGDHYPQSIEIGDDVLEVRWIGMQGATPPGVDALAKCIGSGRHRRRRCCGSTTGTRR